MASCSTCGARSAEGSSASSVLSTVCWVWVIQPVKGLLAIGEVQRLEFVVFQHAQLLFGVCQFALAELDQFDALLVRGQGGIQRQVAAFHCLDDVFQIGRAPSELQS